MVKEKMLEKTNALCNVCLKKIRAEIIEINSSIYLKKTCQEHGEQIELLEEEAEYHNLKKEYDKPGNKIIPETNLRRGCPFDCGLCSEHQQHTCNAIIDITEQCDLNCPTCYASSGKGKHLDLRSIEKIMDYFQKAENNQAEILQISGGEPTTHPQILEIIELAKSKKFRYVMLNTNGLRIARDLEFVEKLARFRDRFEIYLQFDGFSEDTYKKLRGKQNLLNIKLKAIENLKKFNIPITLVATVQKDLNDKEIGKLFEFAINTPGIRGINFQPVAFFGRTQEASTKDRITLSGIIKRLVQQTGSSLKTKDIIPLPCNVWTVGVSYFYRDDKGFLPLTRHIDVKSYLPLIDNTFGFDAEKILKEKNNLIGCCDCVTKFFSSLSKIIPKDYKKMSNEEQMAWWDKHSFRVSIVQFLDKFNFNEKFVKKECVHFITPDLKRIPFSTYNLLYRKNYK